MYRKYLLLLALCPLFIASCSKDDDVKATENMPDWFEIKSEPGEVNQLRYELYRDYGISLYTRDSLGSIQIGVDANGEPVIHTEKFDLSNNLFSKDENLRQIFSKNEADQIVAIKAIRDHVLPALPKAMWPHSILLLDSLIEVRNYSYGEAGRTRANLYVYDKSMRGLGIGMLNGLAEKSEIELKFWIGQIIALHIQPIITEYYGSIAKSSFADKSGSINSSYNYRGVSTGSIYKRNVLTFWGFLRWFADNESDRGTGSQEEDLRDYLAAFYTFGYDYAAFEAYYKKVHSVAASTVLTRAKNKHTAVVALLSYLERDFGITIVKE